MNIEIYLITKHYNGSSQFLSIEWCTRLCAKHFACPVSLNLTIAQGFRYNNHLHFTDVETET